MIDLPSNEVSLLIGTDLAPAFVHYEARLINRSSPVALRSPFGWSLMGPIEARSKEAWSAYVSFDEGRQLNEKLEKYFRMDFPDTSSSRLGKSQNDQRAEEIMNKTCKFVDGRIQVGLLWDKDREIISATIPSDASETTA